MAFFKDFKAFLMKGDIVALATAVIIGGAFNKIVGSLVKDVIMPVIGVLMGGKNVNNLFLFWVFMEIVSTTRFQGYFYDN